MSIGPIKTEGDLRRWLQRNGVPGFAARSVGGGAVGSDLAALEDLTGTGIAVRTGAHAWALRTLGEGTGIDISTPSGVSTDPSIAIDTSVVPRYGGSGTFTAQQTFQQLVVPVVNHAVTDSDFAAPANGMVAIDSANGRWYCRYGGTWHYVILT